MALPLNQGQINALVDQAMAAYDINNPDPQHLRVRVANNDYKTRVVNADETFTVTLFLRSS